MIIETVMNSATAAMKLIDVNANATEAMDITGFVDILTIESFCCSVKQRVGKVRPKNE